ncbi:MAG TPA: hypothetical protein P5057_00975 [Acidobacteriota bacterium]|nr:hypothetical protein [Acidobacteriota bacterium]HRR55510.1 hypothetical protein [Acidobacteriota bacterium]
MMTRPRQPGAEELESPSTILLLLPDPTWRRRYRKFLEFAGFRVLSCGSLQELHLLDRDLEAVEIVVIPPACFPDVEPVQWKQHFPQGRLLLLTQDDAQNPSREAFLAYPPPPERLVSKVRRLLGSDLRLSSCA